MSRTLMLKAGVTAAMALMLFLPLAAISDLVSERVALRDGVIVNIQKSAVTRQKLVGPILVVPFHKTIIDVVVDEKTGVTTRTPRTEDGQLLFVPEQLDVTTRVTTEKRYRGIYSALLYNTTSTVGGTFSVPPNFGVADATPDAATYRWGEAHLVMGMDDTRGIRGKLELTWGGVGRSFQSGTGQAPVASGVHAPVGVLAAAGGVYRFDVNLQLQGAEVLELVPTGKETTMKMQATWPHPSFVGQFLPESRSIGAAGFEAVWRTSRLATSVEQALHACNGQSTCAPLLARSMGVAFIEPVDVYLMLERSSKYGFLFVLFTFVLFGLFELLKRLAIHPVQYALVGVALATFFLLLVALSEHLAFPVAYAIAAGSCVMLLGFYVSYVLKSVRRAGGFSAALALLYAAMFVLLQSEDMALLLGAILLFGIVAAIMLVTRHVDWYRVGESARKPVTPAG